MPQTRYEYTTVGGEDVIRLYNQIAQAATRAQQQNERANRASSASAKALSAGIADVRMQVEGFTTSLGPVGPALASLSSAGIAGAAVAGIAGIATGMVAGAVNAARYADSLLDQSRAIGITAERYQELIFAGRTVGLEQEKLSSILVRFSKNFGELQAGTGGFAKKLGELDPQLLKVLQSATSTTAGLDAFLEKLSGMDDASRKAALAAAGLGKGIGPLLALLHDGADGLKELSDQAQRTGNVLSAGVLLKGSELADKLDVLSATIKNNLTAAFLGLAPALISATDGLTHFIEAANRLLGITTNVGVLPEALEGKAGELTARMQQLERERAGRTSLAALSGQPAGGPETALTGPPPRSLEAIDREIAATQDLRANYVETLEIQKQRADEAKKAALAQEQAGHDVESLNKGLKKDLEDINRLEKEGLEIIERGVKTGAISAEEATRLRAKVVENAQQQRDALDRADRQAAEKAAREQEQREKKAAEHAKDMHESVARAGEQAALAPLEGIAKVEQARDQELERFRQRFQDAEGFEEAFAQFRIDLNAKAEAEIAKIRADAAEKTAREDKQRAEEHAREQERQRKEAERAAEEAFRPIKDLADSLANDLGDAIIGAFDRGEGRAQDFAKSIGDLFRSVAKDILNSFLQSGIEKLFKSLLTTEPGDTAGGGGFLGSLFGGLGNLLNLGGGAKAIPGGVTSLPEGVAGPTMTEEAATKLFKGGESLLGSAQALAFAAASLAGAADEIITSRKDIEKVTLGTAQSVENAVTGIQAALTTGFAAGGAAIGSVVPGVGTVVGAAVGAAVGTAASKAIREAVVESTREGIKEGVSQSGLEKSVTSKLKGDPLLTILGGPLNLLMSSLLGGLLTPDINRIFAKMFRQVLGGPGGLSTAGVPVGARGTAGLPELAQPAAQGSRIIAQAIGAGGQAFGERQEQFVAILLGGVAKRAKKTGEDAAKILAESFAGAFNSSLAGAFNAALAGRKADRERDIRFVTQQFQKASPQYASVIGQVGALRAQGDARIGETAVKKSRDAFAKALGEAFQIGATDDAFRKSLETSVASAFAEGATKALTSGPLGEAFASFFTLDTKKERRQVRRLERQGKTPEALEIITADFVSKVDEFATLVADPTFQHAIADLNDQMLRLQVATAAASGDIKEAADLIEAQLAPAIQTVKDAMNLLRDINTRVNIAVAGPGFAGQRAQVAQLTQERQDVEQRFRARYSTRFGSLGPEDFAAFIKQGQGYTSPTGSGVDAFLGDLRRGGEQKFTPVVNALSGGTDQLLADLKEFSDARLSELEGEIALQEQLIETLKNAQKAFGDLKRQAEEAAHGVEYGAEKQAQDITDITALQTKAVAEGFENPETIADLQEKLQSAISSAAARLNLAEALASTFDGLKRQFEDLFRTIQTALGVTDDRARAQQLRTEYADLQGQLGKKLPGALAGNLTDAQDAADILAKEQANLAEQTQIATNRLNFFTEAMKAFADISEGIEVTLGKLTQRQVYARREAELQKALPGALAGNITDMAKARDALTAAVANATQRFTQFKALVEQFGDIIDQAFVARTGARGQRALLARKRAEIQDLIAKARGGDEDALARLQQLLPETLSLGSQILKGGRGRALDAEIEAAAREAQQLAKDQKSIAEQQLTALDAISQSLGVVATGGAAGAKSQLEILAQQAKDLDDIATRLKTSADLEAERARKSLEHLATIAGAVSDAAGSLLAQANAKLADIKQDFINFKNAMVPVISYLQGRAAEKLTDQFEAIKKLLGAGTPQQSPIWNALNEVARRLPQPRQEGGPVQAGRVYLVGERAAEWFIPGVNGMILPRDRARGIGGAVVTIPDGEFHFHFHSPEPVSRAHAQEFGRTTANAFEAQLRVLLPRLEQRRVA